MALSMPPPYPKAVGRTDDRIAGQVEQIALHDFHMIHASERCGKGLGDVRIQVAQADPNAIRRRSPEGFSWSSYSHRRI